ncbi:endocuticle structural glycoprotein SgAbd-1-like [Penaeus japonicus]|uniref:endocuticle structural glycoprotein SgAbd-1-like n=1 Tax=Penaeus japonicus TaxID=27405 RepID=UPI001C7104FA|nr:endocuticle structural glycoprotein SgAbd-1-like [Penaeus japonicus]
MYERLTSVTCQVLRAPSTSAVMKLFVIAAVVSVCLADKLPSHFVYASSQPSSAFSHRSRPASRPSFSAPRPASRPSFSAPTPASRPSFSAPTPASRPSFSAPTPASRPSFSAPRPASRPSFSAKRPASRPSFSAPRPAPQPTYSAPRSAPGPVVPILVDDRVHPDAGAYSFNVETGDGISRQESGSPVPAKEGPVTAMSGSYSFTLPDGQLFELRYVADENGFQPQSAFLPVAPAFPHPIPAHALRQIERARQEDAARSPGTSFRDHSRPLKYY